MAALTLIEAFEVMRFSPQITSSPGRHLVKIFSLAGADESPHERM
jgi:hypothetical protein